MHDNKLKKEAVAESLTESVVDAGISIGLGAFTAYLIVVAGFTAPVWVTVVACVAVTSGFSYLIEKPVDYVIEKL